MAINALLAKVIFDKTRPTILREESFRWNGCSRIRPPFGIIMKINRNPIPEITEEMVRKDYEFWSRIRSD